MDKYSKDYIRRVTMGGQTRWSDVHPSSQGYDRTGRYDRGIAPQKDDIAVGEPSKSNKNKEEEIDNTPIKKPYGYGFQDGLTDSYNTFMSNMYYSKMEESLGHSKYVVSPTMNMVDKMITAVNDPDAYKYAAYLKEYNKKGLWMNEESKKKTRDPFTPKRSTANGAYFYDETTGLTRWISVYDKEYKDKFENTSAQAYKGSYQVKDPITGQTVDQLEASPILDPNTGKPYEVTVKAPNWLGHQTTKFLNEAGKYEAAGLAATLAVPALPVVGELSALLGYGNIVRMGAGMVAGKLVKDQSDYSKATPNIDNPTYIHFPSKESIPEDLRGADLKYRDMFLTWNTLGDKYKKGIPSLEEFSDMKNPGTKWYSKIKKELDSDYKSDIDGFNENYIEHQSHKSKISDYAMAKSKENRTWFQTAANMGMSYGEWESQAGSMAAAILIPLLSRKIFPAGSIAAVSTKFAGNLAIGGITGYAALAGREQELASQFSGAYSDKFNSYLKNNGHKRLDELSDSELISYISKIDEKNSEVVKEALSQISKNGSIDEPTKIELRNGIETGVIKTNNPIINDAIRYARNQSDEYVKRYMDMLYPDIATNVLISAPIARMGLSNKVGNKAILDGMEKITDYFMKNRIRAGLKTAYDIAKRKVIDIAQETLLEEVPQYIIEDKYKRNKLKVTPSEFSHIVDTYNNAALGTAALFGLSGDARYDNNPELIETAVSAVILSGIMGGSPVNLISDIGEIKDTNAYFKAKKFVEAQLAASATSISRFDKTKAYVDAAIAGKEHKVFEVFDRLKRNPVEGYTVKDYQDEENIAYETISVANSKHVLDYAKKSAGYGSEDHKLLTALIIDHKDSAKVEKTMAEKAMSEFEKKNIKEKDGVSFELFSSNLKSINPEIQDTQIDRLFNLIAQYNALSGIKYEDFHGTNASKEKKDILNKSVLSQLEGTMFNLINLLYDSKLINEEKYNSIKSKKKIGEWMSDFDEFDFISDSYHSGRADLIAAISANAGYEYESTMAGMLSGVIDPSGKRRSKKEEQDYVFIDKKLDQFRKARAAELKDERDLEEAEEIVKEIVTEPNSEIVIPEKEEEDPIKVADTKPTHDIHVDNIPENDSLDEVDDEVKADILELDKLKKEAEAMLTKNEPDGESVPEHTKDEEPQQDDEQAGGTDVSSSGSIAGNSIENIDSSEELNSALEDEDSSKFFELSDENPGLIDEATDSEIKYDKLSHTLFFDGVKQSTIKFLTSPDFNKGLSFKVKVITDKYPATNPNSIEFDFNDESTWDFAHIIIEIKKGNAIHSFNIRSPYSAFKALKNTPGGQVRKFTDSEISALKTFRNNTIEAIKAANANDSLEVVPVSGISRGRSKIKLNRDESGRSIQRPLYEIKNLIDEFTGDFASINSNTLVVGYGRGDKGSRDIRNLDIQFGSVKDQNSGNIMVIKKDPITGTIRRLKVNKKRFSSENGTAELIYRLAVEYGASNIQLMINSKGEIVRTTPGTISELGLTASSLLDKIVNFGDKTKVHPDEVERFGHLIPKQFFIENGRLYYGENYIDISEPGKILEVDKQKVIDYIKNNFHYTVNKYHVWKEDNTDMKVKDVFNSIYEYFQNNEKENTIKFSDDFSISRDDMELTWLGYLVKHGKLVSDIADGVFDTPYAFVSDIVAAPKIKPGISPEPVSETVVNNNDIEAKKADIEKRRQDELNEHTGDILAGSNTYEFVDGGENIAQMKIQFNRDGSKSYIVTVDGVVSQRGKWNKAQIENFTDEEFIIRSQAATEVKKISSETKEEAEKRSGWLRKINAKYDAELAALEAISGTQTENDTNTPTNTEKSLKTPENAPNGASSVSKEDISKLSVFKKKKINISDSGATRLVDGDTKYKTINADYEKSWIKSKLGLSKSDDVSIVDDVIAIADGTSAMGLLRDKAIILWKGAEEGTGYHEAWHAVSLLMLSRTQRMSMYDNVRRTNESLRDATNKEIEEYLAEEFRKYILSGDTGIKNSIVRASFRKMFNFSKGLKNFKNRDISKMYKDIALGVYKSKSFNENSLREFNSYYEKEGATKRLSEYGFEHIDSYDMKAKITEGLAYILFEVSGVKTSENIGAIDLDNLKMVLEYRLDEILSDESISNKSKGIWSEIINNFDSVFRKEIIDRIKLMGISREEEELDKNSTVSEEMTRYDKASYEISKKHNVPVEIKFFLSLTTEMKVVGNEYVSVEDPVLLMNKFVDFSTAWNRTIDEIGNEVTYEAMRNKISELAKKKGNWFFADLGIRLDEMPEEFKTKFFTTMNSFKNKFINAAHDRYAEAGNSESSIKIIDAYVDSQVKKLPAEWGESFISNGNIYTETKTGLSFNSDNVKELISKYNNIKSISDGFLSGTIKLSIEESEDILDEYISMFNSIGIDVDRETMDNLIENKYVNLTRQHSIAYLISKTSAADPSFIFTNILQSILNSGGRIYINTRNGKRVEKVDKKTIYKGEKSIQTLSVAHATTHISPNELMTTGADGARMYAVSLRNYIIDTLSRIGKDKKYFDKVKSVLYNTGIIRQDGKIPGSIILDQLNSGVSKMADIGTFIKFYEENSSDQGRDYFDIGKVEDYIMKMASIFSGYIVSPTMADKKMYYVIKGFKMPDFMSNTLDMNYSVNSAGKKEWYTAFPISVINQFNNYFETEYITIKKAWEEYIAANGDKSKLISTYHYGGVNSRTGNKNLYGHGNGLRFRNFDVLRVPTNNGKILVDLNAQIEGFMSTHGEVDGMNKFFEWMDNRYFNADKQDRINIMNSTLSAALKAEMDWCADNGIINKENSIYYTNGKLDKVLLERFKSKITPMITSTGNPAERYHIETASIANMIAWNMVNGIISNIEFEKIISKDNAYYKDNDAKIKRLSSMLSTGTSLRTDFPQGHELHGIDTFVSSELKDNEIKSFQYDELENRIKAAQVNEVLRVSGEKPIVNLYQLYSSNDESLATLKEKYAEQFKRGEELAKSIYSGYGNKNINETDATVYISPKMYRSILIRSGKWTNEMQDAFEILESDDLSWMADDEKYIKVMSVAMQPLKMIYFGDNFVNGLNIPKLDKMAMFCLFKPIATGDLSNLYSRMNPTKESGLTPIDMVAFSTAVKVGSDNPISFYNEDGSTVSDLTKMKTGIQRFEYLRHQLVTDAHDEELMSIMTQVQKISMSNILKDKIYSNIEIDGVRGATGAAVIDNWNNAIKELSRRGKKNLERELGIIEKDGIYNVNTKKLYAYLKDSAEQSNMPTDVIEMFDAFNIDSPYDIPLQAMMDNAWIESKLLSLIMKHTIDISAPGGMFIQMSAFGLRKMTDSNEEYLINGGKPLNIWNEEDGSMECAVSIRLFKDIIPANIKKQSHDKQVRWLEDNGIIGKSSSITAIGYRIPTQGLASISGLKVVSVLPENIGDTIVLPSEFTRLTGSDFDIDKLFLTRYNYVKSAGGRIEKVKFDDSKDNKWESNSTEAIQNRLIDSMLAIVTEPTSIHETRMSIDTTTDYLKGSVLSQIEKLYPREISNHPFRFNLPSYQTDKKVEYSSGKKGIGPFALANTHHVLTQMTDLSFISDRVTKKFGIERLDRIYGNDGKRILDWLSALINAHVDVAKDPYIMRLGVNRHTYGITSLLIRAGIGENTFFFLSQPIMRDLYSRMDAMIGSYGVDKDSQKSLKKNANILLRIYKAEAKKIFGQAEYDKAISSIRTKNEDGSIDVDNSMALDKEFLVNNIRGLSNKDINWYANQIRVMEAMLELIPYSDALSNLVKYSQVDTKKAGKTFAEQAMFLDEMMNPNLTKYFSGSSRFFTDTPIYEKSINSIGTAKKIGSGLLFRTTSSVMNTAKLMLYYAGRGYMDNTKYISTLNRYIDSKIKSKFFNGFIDSIINERFKDSINDKNNDQIKYSFIRGLFFGDSTLAKRLFDIKSDLKSAYPELEQNRFISAITYSIFRSSDASNPDHITLKSDVSEEQDSVLRIKEGFSDLLSHKDEKIRNFAKDFIVYQFISTGDNSATNAVKISEQDRMDIGLYEFVKNELSNARSKESEYLSEEEMADIFQNRWYDDNLVPEVKLYKELDELEVSDKGIVQFKRKYFPTLSSEGLYGYGSDQDKVIYPISFIDQNQSPINHWAGIGLNAFKAYVKLRIDSESGKRHVILYKLAGYAIKSGKYKNTVHPVYIAVNKRGVKGNGLSIIEHTNQNTILWENILPEIMYPQSIVNIESFKNEYDHIGYYSSEFVNTNEEYVDDDEFETQDTYDSILSDSIDIALSSGEYDIEMIDELMSRAGINTPENIIMAHNDFAKAILSRSEEVLLHGGTVESIGGQSVLDELKTSLEEYLNEFIIKESVKPKPNDPNKILKGKMTFYYGDNRRSDVESISTIDAIRNGERTATTRYESDGNIDYWKSANVGDIIEFEGKDGSIVNVEVTSRLTKLSSNVNPEDWSKKEGWSVEYFNSKVKPRLKEAWQIEYKFISNDNKKIESQNNESKYTNHSGGADGSDIAWDTIGKEFSDIQNNHYWTESKTPHGNVEISKEDFEEGRIESAKAAKRNFGYQYSTMKDSRLIRNWSQVKHSDAIFAIGTIVKTGDKLFPNIKDDTRTAINPSVTGGTGYAVGMAINHNKPVYVFNQTEGSYPTGWYVWDSTSNDFVKTDIPTLTKNFAGIGTRNINDAGKSAIRDVFEKTFNVVDDGINTGWTEESMALANAEYERNNPEEKINVYYGTNENKEFSNFAIRPFKLNVFGNNEEFQTVEQYFQYSKWGFSADTIENETVSENIMDTISPEKAKKLGRKFTGFDSKKWDEQSYEIMKKGVLESFKQNPDSLALLLSTGNAEFTHTQDNTRWRSDFPRILTEVRAELRGDSSIEKSNTILTFEEHGTKYKFVMNGSTIVSAEYSQGKSDKYNKLNHPKTVLDRLMKSKKAQESVKEDVVKESVELSPASDLVFFGYNIDLSKIGIRFKPNDDQVKALGLISDHLNSRSLEPFSLTGSAGTGKTSITKIIVSALKAKGVKMVLASPTNSQKRTLADLSGQKAYTVHQLLGMKPTVDIENFTIADSSDFTDPQKSIIKRNSVIIIDEASMIKDELVDYILNEAKSTNSVVIFIGDKKQLDPVNNNGKQSKALNSTAAFNLTKVERVSDSNPLMTSIQYAVNVMAEKNKSLDVFRMDLYNEIGGAKYVDESVNESVIKFSSDEYFGTDEYKRNPHKAKWLSYTNKDVDSINEGVREYLGMPSHPVVGETIVGEAKVISYEKGDPEIVVENGDYYKVLEVGDVQEFDSTALDGVKLKGRRISIQNMVDENTYYETMLLDGMTDEELNLVAKEILSTRRKYNDLIKENRNFIKDKIEFENALKSDFISMYDIKYIPEAGMTPVVAKKRSMAYYYAITIHKAQGKEFENVFIHDTTLRMKLANVPMDAQMEQSTEYKKLFYVAISRARKNAYIVTNGNRVTQNENGSYRIVNKDELNDMPKDMGKPKAFDLLNEIERQSDKC